MPIVESPFNRMTAREGVRILIHELQGQTVNLLQVLESGVEADHAHCRDFLGVAEGLDRGVYDDYLYKDYFLNRYGIGGIAEVIPRRDPSVNDEVTISRCNGCHWPAGNVIEAFQHVDFLPPFAFSHLCDLYINASRGKGKSNFYRVDVALGNGVPRNERSLLRVIESGARIAGVNEDELVVTDQGYKLLVAFLATKRDYTMIG